MKTTYNILREFRDSFKQTVPYCRVLAVSQSLTEDDVLVTEVYFAYMVDGETSAVYTCHSNIDSIYLFQFSDQKIAKEIVSDILVELAHQMKDDCTEH